MIRQNKNSTSSYGRWIIIDEADIKHLSPARSEHINVFGRYSFPVEEELKRRKLRPVRKPGEDK